MQSLNFACGDNDMTIAQTILNQMGGSGKLVAMLGARNFSTEGNDLRFRFRGSRKSNYVKITLNSMDLYDIEFGKIRKYELIPGESFFDVYADQLIEIFESVTGLRTSL